MTANSHFANASAALQRAGAITCESICAKARESLGRPDEETPCRTAAACRENHERATNVAKRCAQLAQRLRAIQSSPAPLGNDAIDVSKAITGEVGKYLVAAARDATSAEDIHCALSEAGATIHEALIQIEDMLK